MKVLQHLICAMIVFVAYVKLGYYSSLGIVGAIHSYFAEKKRLQSQVLMVTRYGLPIGTLMCSRDNCGDLPTDGAFPLQMVELRQRYGSRLGYFGKFAVIPSLQGKLVGKQLLVAAVTDWSLANAVDVAVMMVNPKHVGMYRRYGAIEIARNNGTTGMEKAPAVLMVLDYTLSPEIVRRREQSGEKNYLQKVTA